MYIHLFTYTLKDISTEKQNISKGESYQMGLSPTATCEINL